MVFRQPGRGRRVVLGVVILILVVSLFSTLVSHHDRNIESNELHLLKRIESSEAQYKELVSSQKNQSASNKMRLLKRIESSEEKYQKIIQLLLEQRGWNQNIATRLKEQRQWKEYQNYKEKLIRHLNGKEPEVIHKANPHVFLDDVTIDCNTNYKLLFLVSSAYDHFQRRNLIRATWGNNTLWSTWQPWKVIFVIGGVDDKTFLQKIQNESKTYRDIMVEDISDEYYKLSYKVMIGFHWVYDSFNFDFVMKVDDDIFVQIDRVMKRLENDFAKEGYIGNVMHAQPVIRSRVSEADHPNNTYDPYCSGGGFIISKETIRKIIPLFDWDKPLIIDDAYIGELIFKVGIKAYHVPDGFYMWNNWCEYNSHLLISHPAKKRKCMEFFMAHSLIENGKMQNDTIKQQKYGDRPDIEQDKSEKTFQPRNTSERMTTQNINATE